MLRMKRIMRIAPDLADVPSAKASAEQQSNKQISNRQKRKKQFLKSKFASRVSWPLARHGVDPFDPENPFTRCRRCRAVPAVVDATPTPPHESVP
jgi:hypothetical protein